MASEEDSAELRRAALDAALAGDTETAKAYMATGKALEKDSQKANKDKKK